MAQLQKTFLNNREDFLSILLFMAVNQDNTLRGPDDDDWIDDDDDDDDDFDVETGDDIDEDVDEDWEDPDLIPDTEDDDDDDDVLDESEGSVTGKKTTEGEALESGELDTDFEDRPYTTRRRTGRMVDHEPGTSGFEPPL